MKNSKLFRGTLQDAINLEKSGKFVYDSKYERDTIIAVEFLMRVYIKHRHRKAMMFLGLLSVGFGFLASVITYLILI